MRIGALGRIAAITACVILAAMVLPWWSVAVVGFAVGVLYPAASPLEAGVSGLLGWGTLLLLAAWQGPVGVLLNRLSVLLHLPGAALILLALVLATLLCWSAAQVARSIRALLTASAAQA